MKKLKQFVKDRTPEPGTLSNRPLFRFMSGFLTDQNIWHLNRRSIAGGFFIGIFTGLLPIPGQMVLAALLAFILRAHLPLSLASTWVSNPITYAPIFYFNYRVGIMVVGDNSAPMTGLDIAQLYENITAIWWPLLLGSVLNGLFFGSLAYLIVRISWRIHVLQNWDKRKLRNRFRKKKSADAPANNTSDENEPPTH